VNPFDLSETVAVVTGGNGGIGLGMAEGLVGAGAAVAIWGTNPAKNEAATERLTALGGNVEAFACDVSDEEAVAETFAATLHRFGKVDACFANAGVAGTGVRFDDMDLEEWRRVVAVNLDGAFLTFRAAVRHMLERGEGGSLVATSSLASVMGMPRGEHYAATKAGLSAVVRSLAVEYGRYGIRANAVLPGWIETAMTAGWMSSDRFRDAVLPRVPAGRWGTPEDFSGIAVYLASDASRYHSGDTIVIDGAYRVF
jgi:NAD(P)-dependent dehydrogenase (short-subunit alcohol dehydrogenase family)